MGQKKDENTCIYCNYSTKDCSNFRRHMLAHENTQEFKPRKKSAKVLFEHAVNHGSPVTTERSMESPAADPAPDTSADETVLDAPALNEAPKLTEAKFTRAPFHQEPRHLQHERTFQSTANDPFLLREFNTPGRFRQPRGFHSERFHEHRGISAMSSLEAGILQSIFDHVRVLEERVKYLEYQNSARHSYFN